MAVEFSKILVLNKWSYPDGQLEDSAPNPIYWQRGQVEPSFKFIKTGTYFLWEIGLPIPLYLVDVKDKSVVHVGTVRIDALKINKQVDGTVQVEGDYTILEVLIKEESATL